MANELETKAIDAAFAGVLDKAFTALHFAYTSADGDTAQQTQADERFKTSVSLARKVRQQALKQL
ncbi:MAG TPA: hypothetical protein VGQ91_08375 [Ideonella sp.]|jgi:hypothetical protein|nr:hypothetical protein [Ideonella sp.]